MSVHKKILLKWAAVVVYMVSIWGLSSMRLPEIPLAETITFADKIVHFAVFGVLAFLVYLLASEYLLRPRWRWLTAVVVTALWGVIDEIHQAFVPGRFADVVDAAADLTGALLIASIIYFREVRIVQD